MERFAYYFAWFQLAAVSVLWPLAALTNTSEPPIVLHISFFALWQGAVIFITSSHIDKKRKESK